LSISRCRSRYGTYLTVSVVSFFFKFNGIDAITTKSHNLYGERTSSILREWKWSFLSFFVEKPLYAIYFTRIKEQVDERKNTVGIHKNTDCFLKNIPLNIRNMLTLSIKNSEDVLVGSDFFLNLLLFFTNHYLSLPNQGTFCIYIYICKWFSVIF
jgi:hypothetical protein